MGEKPLPWRGAVPPALRMLPQKDSRADPHLEILRPGVEHEDAAARDLTITLILDGALVTGTVISTDTWERLYLRQPGDQDGSLRRIVRAAAGHLDSAADAGRRRPGIGRCFLHLRDVTHRDVTHQAGRTGHTLALWRRPIAAIGGRSLGRSDKDRPGVADDGVPVRVCAVLVDPDVRVRVIRRRRPGGAQYSLPGGPVVAGEQPAAAPRRGPRRELREELGLDLPVELPALWFGQGRETTRPGRDGLFGRRHLVHVAHLPELLAEDVAPVELDAADTAEVCRPTPADLAGAHLRPDLGEHPVDAGVGRAGGAVAVAAVVLVVVVGVGPLAGVGFGVQAVQAFAVLPAAGACAVPVRARAALGVEAVRGPCGRGPPLWCARAVSPRRLYRLRRVRAGRGRGGGCGRFLGAVVCCLRRPSGAGVLTGLVRFNRQILIVAGEGRSEFNKQDCQDSWALFS
ncbi:NUDIX hydrolase [Kitasatospora griseola]|uniref:NUDIX hydrolase n=1 Tax=Kitasatospora griseola TaxID=2064 RepID=UPI003431EF33